MCVYYLEGKLTRVYSVWLQVSNQHGRSKHNLNCKCTTKINFFSTQKRINIILNGQYFVENHFITKTELVDVE